MAVARSLSVARAAASQPERLFLLDGSRALTFSRSAEIVAGLIEDLALESVARSDRSEWTDRVPVAIEGVRTLGQLLAFCALFELHIPFVILDPRWTDAQRSHVLARCSAQRILDTDQIAVAVSQRLSDGARELRATRPAGWDRDTPPRRDSDDGGVVLFTSGTTGEAKGVRLSARALTCAAAASTDRLQWLPGERWLLNLPLAHVSGLSVLTRSLETCGAVVLAKEQPFVAASLGRDD